METKSCKGCLKELPIGKFRGGRNFCKKCNRNKGRNRLMEISSAIKVQPCKDCGHSYPFYVMQFDHLPTNEKSFDISDGVHNRIGVKKLQEEINKCEVVCANCHAARTYKRLQEFLIANGHKTIGNN